MTEKLISKEREGKMTTFNSWYEIYVAKRNNKVVIDNVDSLEEAEEIKVKLAEKGIKVVIKEWKLDKEIPIFMGEV